LNTVAITGYDAQEVTRGGWGFHAGGDVSVFFSRVVGLDGFVRFNKGTIVIDEPMSELLQDVKVGGLQTGGGLRLRF
jgi:hypothetical protein